MEWIAKCLPSCFWDLVHPRSVGDFIRTFEFPPGSPPTLPIVQPGGFLPFPIEVTPAENVFYEETESRTGVRVPQGVYNVRWLVNPSDDAELALLVNGTIPLAQNGFPYGKQIKVAGAPIEAEYTIVANQESNFIALVNVGATLFTLSDIPNTRLGSTVILTQFTIERVG